MNGWTLRIAAFASATVMLTACGSGSDRDDAGGSGDLLVAFMPASSDLYVAEDRKALEAEAKELGFSVKVFENNFDQSEQDQQVQQYIASGEKPAAFLWWPSDAQAGINSSRLLSRLAPVIQFNQLVLPEGEEYVTSYAGPNDAGVGEIAGDLAIKARQQKIDAGEALSSEGGNLLEFSFPEGYRGGIDRHEGFVTATQDEPFNLLRNEPTGFDAQSGFEAANQLIPKYKAQGIDFIYCSNAGLAVGVIRALKQNGLEPNKDVTVIAGDANGAKPTIESGELYGAVVQAPAIEGALVVRTAAQYLAADDVKPGTTALEPTPDAPALSEESPSEVTFMPLAPITKDTYADLRIWGRGVEDLIV